MNMAAVRYLKILLLGKDGQVGWELQRTLMSLGDVVSCGRVEADFEDLDRLRALVRRIAPDIIVNAAAYTAVDKAEFEPVKARCINAQATGVLAQEANRLNAWLVHYSTDYVFDGKKSTPYSEGDITQPLSVYGKTKLEGEQLIQAYCGRYLIFRTSWVYGIRGNNFAKTILELAREKNELRVVADQYGAPTSAQLIADVTALALHQIVTAPGKAVSLAGIYHLVAGGQASWYQFAQHVLRLARARGASLACLPQSVAPIPATAYPTSAARPYNSCLATDKLQGTFGVHLADWQVHVARFINEIIAQENHAA